MGPGPLKCGRPSRDRRRSTVARCASWTSACVPWTRASRSRSPSRKAVSASCGGSRRRWTSRSSGCTGCPTDQCGWEDWRRASFGGSPRTKASRSSDCMDLRDRPVMILGGSGLVGHAVARRLLGAAPRRVVLVALFEEEVRATARALEPHRGRATIEVEWGNVFLPASLARLERGAVMANPEHRRLMLQDLLSDLTDDVCQVAEQILEHQPAVLRVRHDRPALQTGEARGEEDIAPLDLDRRPPPVRLERPRGGAHLLFEQGDEHHAPRRGAEQPARHGVADQPAAPEDHHGPVTKVHAVARWPRFRARRAAETCPPPVFPAALVRRTPGAATRP